METEFSTYTLGTRQLREARAILEREQRVHTPSPRQEKIFELLNLATRVFGVAGGILFLDLLLSTGLRLFGADEWNSYTFLFLYLLVPVLMALGLGMLVLFFLNLPYLLQLLRQYRSIRRFGLTGALRAPWQAERRKRRLRNVAALGGGLAGVLLLVLLESLFVQFLDHLLPGFWGALLVAFGAVLLYFGYLGFVTLMFGAVITTYVMQRRKERLELISSLLSSLEEYRDEVEQGRGGPVPLPAEVYEKIAQIERAQISRERVQSILQASREPGTPPYVLQKSLAAQQAQAGLDPATCVRVQDRIDALTVEPRPPDAAGAPDSGILQLRVPGTPVTLRFVVDEQARRVQILSVESAPADAAAGSRVPGG